MNQIHHAIISYIRENNKSSSEEILSFMALSDEQIAHRMFLNYRGSRGLRLTSFGLQIMQNHFKGYEISIPEDEKIQPLHLIFLDGKARMPYYCGDGKIVVYDYMLGVKLRLVDGRLSILMEID